ncbi:hypothetical protein BJY01DRAFT_127806 [Aspergillus pseudoustus]|uniref:HTH CENPB-type domain-containing protein n=1 Tax=Aspergillus pseudoustus TaxID=1810923 RepID=A0ABR4KHK1_9EURO
MSTIYIYVLCQALDLRVLHAKVNLITASLLPAVLSEQQECVQMRMRDVVLHYWRNMSSSDLADRCITAANCSVGEFLDRTPTEPLLSSHWVSFIKKHWLPGRQHRLEEGRPQDHAYRQQADPGTGCSTLSL